MKAMPARAILKDCNIAIGSDFHTLGSTEIDNLIIWADATRYRSHGGASGSRARYFHAALQRAATDRAFSGFKYGRKP